MNKKVSKAARVELVTALSQRYLAASRIEKAKILDEFVAVSGYHRKHAIRMLGSGTHGKIPRHSAHRVYDEA